MGFKRFYLFCVFRRFFYSGKKSAKNKEIMQDTDTLHEEEEKTPHAEEEEKWTPEITIPIGTDDSFYCKSTAAIVCPSQVAGKIVEIGIDGWFSIPGIGAKYQLSSGYAVWSTTQRRIYHQPFVMRFERKSLLLEISECFEIRHKSKTVRFFAILSAFPSLSLFSLSLVFWSLLL